MQMRADDIDPTDFTVAITLEPAGGSQLPTTPPIAQSA